MSRYSGMFGAESAPIDPLADIKDWLNAVSTKTTAKRINYILNSIQPINLKPSDVGVIGDFNIAEATEANKCVDQVVTDFAALKDALEPPKMLILEALALIEGDSKAKGFIGFLRRPKRHSSPAEIRDEVKIRLTKALEMFRIKEQYQLNPFIEGLREAKRTMERIDNNLNDTIFALNYLTDRCKDPVLKDLVIRRQQMFVKSYALMKLNAGQLDDMEKVCKQNQTFIEELESTVIPIIENVIRSAVISGKDGLQDISTALKGIL
jgi:hypothetical protein